MKGDILSLVGYLIMCKQPRIRFAHPLFRAPKVIGRFGPMQWTPNEHLLMTSCEPPHEFCTFDILVNYSAT